MITTDKETTLGAEVTTAAPVRQPVTTDPPVRVTTAQPLEVTTVPTTGVPTTSLPIKVTELETTTQGEYCFFNLTHL